MKNKKFLVADEKVYENKVYVKTYVTKLGITWFTAKIIKWFENGHSISEVKGY